MKKHAFVFWYIALGLVLLSEAILWLNNGKGTASFEDTAALRSITPTYYKNYQIDGSRFMPENNDPQIGCYLEPCEVESILIRFTEPLDVETGIQVFYAESGEKLSEANSVRLTAGVGTDSVIVDLPDGVYDHLRVDINGKFSFSGIQVSDVDPVIHKDAKEYLKLGTALLATVLLAALLYFLFSAGAEALRSRVRPVFWQAFRFRVLLGVATLALAVLLELSGSSIGMWDSYVHDVSHPDEGVILGVNRPIRSDEWALFTPMTLSQYHNDFGLESDIIRGTDTDVYMVYGQPVRDWSIIFRPFQIGYLFLDAAKGLAFYWFGKLIALFLVSLEFGLLLADRKKRLALAYAFLVTLAPVVQWWFSVNAFPDMLVYGQGIVLCVAGYMGTTSYQKRALYAAGLFLLCGAYLLVMYPPWQISFFYVFLVIGLWVIVTRWKESRFEWKKDIPLLGGAGLLLLICMGLIIYRSWDVIRTVMNSAYPGQRLEKGGMGLSALFRYVGNLFLPFISSGLPHNECEMALFYDCFPLGIAAAVMLRRRGGRRDGLSFCLFGLLTFLGLYVVLGFPPFLSKLLLMSKSQAGRAIVALSYVNLLLLIRSLAMIEQRQVRPRRAEAVILAACFAVIMVYYSSRWAYSGYYTPKMFLICMIILAIISLTALIGQKPFCVIMIALSIVIGGTVNPVRTGLDFMENNSLGQAVQAFSEQSDGKWLAVSDPWMLGNYLIANGAPTINSTNTYINTELWKVLDPDGQYYEMYNRYAYQSVDLTDSGQLQVELRHADLNHIVMNVDDLPRIGVEYIVSKKDLSGFSNENILLCPVFSSPDVAYTIYHVEKP